MDATSTKTLRLRNIPINSGMEASARSLGRAYPSLVRPHALHSPSVNPEHPFGTAIGGSLVPPISPSSWSYVEPVFREIAPSPLLALLVRVVQSNVPRWCNQMIGPALTVAELLVLARLSLVRGSVRITQP